jgi:hypothetical protein
MEVIPENFGLKYKPPKLGIQYYMKGDPEAHFVHEIPLSFVSKLSNPDAIAREI